MVCAAESSSSYWRLLKDGLDPLRDACWIIISAAIWFFWVSTWYCFFNRLFGIVLEPVLMKTYKHNHSLERNTCSLLQRQLLVPIFRNSSGASIKDIIHFSNKTFGLVWCVFGLTSILQYQLRCMALLGVESDCFLWESMCFLHWSHCLNLMVHLLHWVPS